MMSTHDIKQLISCIKFESPRAFPSVHCEVFICISTSYQSIRISTCLIQSFDRRNSTGVKHPEMAVVTGTNTGLTWKSYMVSDNISAEN